MMRDCILLFSDCNWCRCANIMPAREGRREQEGRKRGREERVIDEGKERGRQRGKEERE